jgi:PPE-repeat protein
LYEKVSILYPGKTANVIAKHVSADYWVIENPAGEGNCWLWGYYATLSGPADELPLWNPPATPTPMPTTNTVTLQVRVDTYCRVGPGIPYDIVTILRIGKTANVIARNAQETYWVIENPAGDGHCWVWGYYATLTGPVAELPIWAPPPTP